MRKNVLTVLLALACLCPPPGNAAQTAPPQRANASTSPPSSQASDAAALRAALEQAGENRPQLQRVLDHYRQLGDSQKLAAAEFLIANLPGHGYIVTALYDKDKTELPFDALDFPNFGAADAAIKKFEQERGGSVDFARKRFDADLTTITADFLIENIDLAFQAWRERPWARDVSFEAFLNHVLPYRGSEEPLNHTRAALLQRFDDLAAKLKNPADMTEAAAAIQHNVAGWIGFSDLYYLHPTDQSYEEMCRHKLGRCEDISNMQLYALRANGIPAASDYTPFWADRDNNHAWEVILDATGRGHAGLSNRAAKVYRKTFAQQEASLGRRKAESEDVPPWLSRTTYLDVTDQYVDTTDVDLPLTSAPPGPTRWAYLCVFNGGEWQAIHWAEISTATAAVASNQPATGTPPTANFTRMGRNIAYLPAYYLDKKLVPAAAPFILEKSGHMRPLDGAAGRTLSLELTITRPATPDADTRRDKPMLVVQPNKPHELFYWDGGWQSLGKRTVESGAAVTFDNVPAHRLYWLVADGSDRLERIFTIEDENKQVFW